MIVRKLRLQRGWSQEQLAEMSGLSVRTIQRIEKGDKPGLESLKSLAAVFEVQVDNLSQESEMKDEPLYGDSVTVTDDERKVMKRVREIRGFYSHVVSYVTVMALLLVINLFTSPDYFWVVWPALGWGVGIISHGLNAFDLLNFFGPEWEKRQIEKRLGRKL
ncbi:helix-turn-helix domain-containing protein [Thaumasiovibrio subtropicus]|uniref:helix-turn-helix domain-containing protein n=1 Tax=Thaumasiovibrio subtropicus TaxID=1891207 RepID=UPI000B3613F1|nr:helix-turn-helix domain-containing protein [Thaumasiovibrio subtropicus]